MNFTQFILCPFGRFFANPNHLSGVVFARLMTNMATLAWCGIVLCNDNTLVSSGSRYAFVTAYVHENVIAGLFGSIAILQVAALWLHKSHGMLCALGYAVMTLGWGFVFWYNVIEPGPVFATATSLSGTVAFASLYAFIDGRERFRGSRGSEQ